jgi:hypothetical protein
MNPETVTIKFFFRNEMFFKIMLYFIFFFSMVIISNNLLKWRVVAFIMLLISILPLFAMKKVVKYFTKDMSLKIFDNKFEFFSSNNKSFKKELNFQVNFDELRSYQIEFPSSETSSIKFKFNNQSTTSYTFIKNDMDNIDVKELITKINQRIKNYNLLQSDNKRNIVLMPSFMASEKGKYCIIGIAVLFILAFLIQIILPVNKFPITLLIGAGLIFQLYYLRKNDIEAFETMREHF